MKLIGDHPRVIVLSGASGSGKSTVCRRLVALAQPLGLEIGGVLTLPRIENGRTIGLDVQDIVSGAVQPLAEAASPTDGPSTGRFNFHARGIAGGNQLLRSTSGCEWLVIDELGPLELLHEQGWVVGLEVLNHGAYGRAVVVVRAALVARFAELLRSTPFLSIEVTTDNRDNLPAQILGTKKS